MMAKQKDETSNNILSSIDELLTRQPPRMRSRHVQPHIRLLDENQQIQDKSPNNSEHAQEVLQRQQQLQKDFPATKALATAHPNPHTAKIPASIMDTQHIQKLTVEKSTVEKPKVRVLHKDMEVKEVSEGWREKLSLLALEKEEIRLLMQQVKQDVRRQLPKTIPPLVEKFLNQRLDSILERRTYKK